MFPGKTLVLGGGGFLGSYISNSTSSDSVIHLSSRVTVTSGRKPYIFDISQNNLEDLKEYILKQDFECVINCVANANIEDCEKRPGNAQFLNSDLPMFLAETTNISGSRFVHFSTDAVFDGIASFKKESDLAKPHTTYGKSKLHGENLVMQANSKSLIARVNFFGLSHRKVSLFNYFYHGLSTGKQVSGYSNVFFTPLYVEDTVAIIQRLIQLDQTGIMHVAGRERISKLEFGQLIAKSWGLDEELISATEYKSEIDRALDLSLDTSKLSRLGIEIPSIEQSLVMMREANVGSLK
jgi:dTDP-4-dehydrorhamnose reductase